jgi:hypothetical protein
MVDRNFEPDKICNICNNPFKPSNGGSEISISGVDATICGQCYEGMAEIIAGDEPHVTVDCPKCDHEIGLRIEVIDDT